MKLGIGLPNPVPGTAGETLVEWARKAESAGFSSLATIDRIAYPSYESLVTLAAVAGATERIGLVTNVLLAPTRNPVLLAKMAASVDQLSGGRLTLGLGVGSRKDDFDAIGQRFEDRGKHFDQTLELMHRVWKGELVNGAQKPIGPAPVRSVVPILIGGYGDPAIRRVVKWGIGYTVGGSGPEQAAPFERLAANVHLANVIALSTSVEPGGNPDVAEKYVERLNSIYKRDVVIVDLDKKGIADANKEEVGQI